MNLHEGDWLERAGLTSRHAITRRPRSADMVVHHITRMVLERPYGQGERIGSESELVDSFGVSRAVLREGLRLLEREGVVTVKPGPAGGVFSAHPTSFPLSRSIDMYGAFHDVTQDDLVEARMELEVLTTRLAAARATEEDLFELGRHNQEWIRLIGEGDTDAQARANVKFHIALTRAAHNPVFVAFMDALESLLYETALTPAYPDRRFDYVVYSHEYILEHVRQGSIDEAGAAMRHHLETFRPNAWRKGPEPGAIPAADSTTTTRGDRCSTSSM